MATARTRKAETNSAAPHFWKHTSHPQNRPALRCYISFEWRLSTQLTAAAANGGTELASREELVARIISNRGKILRYAWIAQLVGALVFLGLGYLIGHEHFHLIREGVRAPGTIIGYKQKNFRSSSGSSSTGYMPIVEFHTNDRFVQFQDWLGGKISGSTNIPVMVLYDPANPTAAIIDRPVWNWIPWAPIFALGLFLLLVSINGFFRSQRPAETS